MPNTLSEKVQSAFTHLTACEAILTWFALSVGIPRRNAGEKQVVRKEMPERAP
jgi:hypothetical protein